MLSVYKSMLKEKFNISDEVIEMSKKALDDISGIFKEIDDIKDYNQLKVLHAMQSERLSDAHFTNTTGYGYGDIGRDTLDRVYSKVFCCEDALVRPHIVSGTHAITLALSGNLRPNDTILSITGRPYDTLLQVIGIEGENNGSLKEFGIKYKQIDLLDNGKIDINSVIEAIKSDNTIKMATIQRSTGYGLRPSLQINDIKEAIAAVKSVRDDVICFVDNCYGEFIDILEPTEVGADIIAGSLIKNIGGGIAPTGGYVCGRKNT